MLGHGAMVSHSAYLAGGGFPLVVAEDICLSLEIRKQGLHTIFARNIICEEEFPIDYLAFKKRHSKWTQGSMEYIKKYTWSMLRSNMTWYEKLDTLMFTAGLPLSGLFTVYVMIQVVALPFLHDHLGFPLWMIAPTALFWLAPTLNDIVSHWAMDKRRLISYLLHSMILYGSMYFVTVNASLKVLFKPAFFHITPKEADRVSFAEAIRSNRLELSYALVLAAIAAVTLANILPVIFIIFPTLFAPYLTLVHNQKKVRIDEPMGHGGRLGSP